MPRRPLDTEVADLAQALGLLVRRVRAESGAHELSLTESAVLARLDREGPATTADLARAERMRPQSMGTTIAALEELGCVVRKPHPTHGRMNRLELTPRGRTVLQQGGVRVKRVESDTFADFSPYERTELPELLRRALRRVRHGPGRGRDNRAGLRAI